MKIFFFINLSPQCKPCHYDEWKWLVRIFFFYIGWGATLIRRVKSGHFDWAWRAGREVKKNRCFFCGYTPLKWYLIWSTDFFFFHWLSTCWCTPRSDGSSSAATVTIRWHFRCGTSSTRPCVQWISGERLVDDCTNWRNDYSAEWSAKLLLKRQTAYLRSN